ncbi:hypothetical protein ACFWQL_02400 [Amycolatopsis thermoflava]|uniref:hypothetical protein n=1 Tax=Amycolatopsis thermoflava TaxID=84480 RepID=UPI00365784C6
MNSSYTKLTKKNPKNRKFSNTVAVMPSGGAAGVTSPRIASRHTDPGTIAGGHDVAGDLDVVEGRQQRGDRDDPPACRWKCRA